MWTNLVLSTTILLTQTALLAPLRFLSRPDVPAGVFFCPKKLLRATLPFYAVSFVSVMAWGLLVVFALPASLQHFKIAFHGAIWANHSYAAGTIYCSRQTYKYETTSPQVLAIGFAGMYVYIASQSQVYTTSLGMLLFAIASLAVKVSVQELAKCYIVIGCSAAILFFFFDHPMYMYAPSEPLEASSATSSAHTLRTQFELIGFQLVLEIIFDSVRKLSSFLAFMFMAIAVTNIGISSLLCLK